MNQLINVENLSLEQIKEIEFQITKKKVELLAGDLKTISNDQKKIVETVKVQEIKLEEVESKTDHLRKYMTVDTKASGIINRAGKLRITEALGGKDSPAYKLMNRIIYSNFWSYYKYKMQVNSYRDTRAEDVDVALEFISNWKPKKQFQDEIDVLNAITQVDEVKPLENKEN